MRYEDRILANLSKAIICFANDLRAEYADLEELYEAALARAIAGAISVMMPAADAESEEIFQGLKEEIDSLPSGSQSLVLSECFEQLRGMRLIKIRSGSFELSTSAEKRSKGVYYTPAKLAEATARPAIEHALKSVRVPDDLAAVSILDPAVGCGIFLMSALRIAFEILRRKPGFRDLTDPQIKFYVASSCLYGVDIDPVAILISRALLVSEVGVSAWSGFELDSHLKVGDALACSRIDWIDWFPDVAKTGFSAVITNPPWSKLRPLRNEFFEHIDANVRKYQGTSLQKYISDQMLPSSESEWKRHVERRVLLSKQLRTSSEYEVNSSQAGDADLYKYFTERAISLLAPAGMAGLLLPSGVLRAQGASGLRVMLRKNGHIQRLVEYINKKRMFDIHSMYRFCAVNFVKSKPGGISEAVFSRTEPDDGKGGVELSLAYLKKVGGSDSLIPEVRTVAERDLLLKLYSNSAAQPGGGEAGGWVMVFRRELDMTNDSLSFIEAEELSARQRRAACVIPVYEGRMVQQFNFSAKEYSSGQGRSAVWNVSAVNTLPLKPHYYVEKDYALSRGWMPGPRAAYCEISGHANERTILACIVPGDAICGNKVPTVKFPGRGMDTSLLWVAYANSLVVDWIMRRWISTTVNQFYWRNIPLPAICGSEQEAYIVMLSKRLQGLAQHKFEEGGESPSISRALIDAMVLDFYGITDEEFGVILQDFNQFSRAKSGAGENETLQSLVRKARAALVDGFDQCHQRLASVVKVSSGELDRIYAPSALLRASTVK